MVPTWYRRSCRLTSRVSARRLSRSRQQGWATTTSFDRQSATNSTERSSAAATPVKCSTNKPSIGLVVGALGAASGTTGLVAKNSVAAVVLVACATFGAGALTTLNASQRKVQASAAGAAYRELESEARRLRYVELPYVSLADALTKLRAITARRMSLQKVAEPPSAEAFRRADRNRRERLAYGKIRTFGEKHKVVFWVPNAAPTSNAAVTQG